MLLQSEFPPDIRLEKEITTLSSNGYKITLLCNQYDQNKDKGFPECEIIRIKALFRSKKLNKMVNFPICFNPRLIYYAIKTYLRSRPDVIHAHDLPMVPLGILLKWVFGVKLIYDMHENYPAALRFFDKKGLVNKIFRNPRIAEQLDRYCIKHSDHIIPVVEENKERLIKLGVPDDKISVVSNTVDLKTFAAGSPDEKIASQYRNKFVIIYTGTVSPERGLDTPVKAMTILKEKIPNSLLLIIGEGPSEEPLEQYIKTNGLENYVSMLKWCGHENLVSYLAAADICIIPQPNNEFINTTIPHKLFEYMSQSKPVIVSDALPLKRIVEETNCGVYFISNSHADFAEKVIQMKESKTDYGSNGRKAVEFKYNWENDSKQLLHLYSKL
jgi:glycosyltransferase involved in cell wall biosynthesis